MSAAGEPEGACAAAETAVAAAGNSAPAAASAEFEAFEAGTIAAAAGKMPRRSVYCREEMSVPEPCTDFERVNAA